MTCPACGKENDDNWPIEVTAEDGAITTEDGGCQKCWEEQVDKDWWDMVCVFEEG